MGRDEQSGLVPSMLEGPCSLDRHGALPIGPCHVHCLKLILGVSKGLGQVPHLINVGLLSRTELPIHVPFENSLQALTVLLGH